MMEQGRWYGALVATIALRCRSASPIEAQASQYQSPSREAATAHRSSSKESDLVMTAALQETARP